MEETMIMERTKESKVTTKKGMKAKLYLVVEKMARYNALLAVVIIMAAMFVAPVSSQNAYETITVYADNKDDKKADKKESGTTADTTWDNTMEWVSVWVIRLGGVLALIGAIEVGMGFSQDNPSAKTTGWKFIVGGGIVAAAGGAWETFIQ